MANQGIFRLLFMLLILLGANDDDNDTELIASKSGFCYKLIVFLSLLPSGHSKRKILYTLLLLTSWKNAWPLPWRRFKMLTAHA